MEWFLLSGIVVITAGVFAYAIFTNKIISGLDKDIARLKAENRRLKAKAMRKEHVEIINIYEQPKGANIPDYKNF